MDDSEFVSARDRHATHDARIPLCAPSPRKRGRWREAPDGVRKAGRVRRRFGVTVVQSDPSCGSGPHPIRPSGPPPGLRPGAGSSPAGWGRKRRLSYPRTRVSSAAAAALSGSYHVLAACAPQLWTPAFAGVTGALLRTPRGRQHARRRIHLAPARGAGMGGAYDVRMIGAAGSKAGASRLQRATHPFG